MSPSLVRLGWAGPGGGVVWLRARLRVRATHPCAPLLSGRWCDLLVAASCLSSAFAQVSLLLLLVAVEWIIVVHPPIDHHAYPLSEEGRGRGRKYLCSDQIASRPIASSKLQR
jgi:hypothetical protein